jgi:hypothetical protein
MSDDKRAEAQPVEDELAPEQQSNIPLGTKHTRGPNITGNTASEDGVMPGGSATNGLSTPII